MLKINRESILNIIMFIFVFCTDTFIVFANSNRMAKTIFQIALGLVTLFLLYETKLYSQKSVSYFLAMAICILCTIVYNQDYSKGNFVKIFLLAIGMIVSNAIDFELFRKAYIKIITLICCFSICIFLLSYVIKDFGPLPIIENTSHVKMVFAGLSNIVSSNAFRRNYGPFWEPGVYSIYLSLGVLFCFLEEQKITKRVIILVVGIVTTLSTTGFIMIVFLIAYYVFGYARVSSTRVSSIKKGKSVRYIVAAVLLIMIVALLFLNDDLNRAVFSKLNRNNYEYLSTVARLSSVFGNLQIWKENPIFGIGATKLQEAYDTYLIQHGQLANSNTNGLLLIFSMYGTVLGLFTVYGFVKLAASLDKSSLGKLIILFILLCMLFSEPLTTSCLFNILIFYGLRDRSIYGRGFESIIAKR